MHLSHPTPARALAAACLGTALLAAPAAAQEAPTPNPREVPNAACGRDTPQAAFADRGAAPAPHRRSIDCVAALDITRGTGAGYAPAETVTRGQMASFVARSLEAAGHQLPPPQDQGFDDVEDSVHRDRIRQLAAVDVVQGRGDGSYDPEGTVTRAQMASYLVRAAEWAHGTAYAPVGTSPYFLDVEDTVHSEAIRTGYELFLYEGRAAGEYAPGAPVQRAAMATFLTRALDLVWTGERQSTHQTFLVAPQERIEDVPADGQVELRVLARYDSDEDGVRSSLHLALFPCSEVAIETLPATFSDGDDDGLADRIAATDAGRARIDSINGEPVGGEVRLSPNVSPQADGTIVFTVVSSGADCTVPVVFEDRAPTDVVRVDANGLSANPYGIGSVSWR